MGPMNEGDRWLSTVLRAAPLILFLWMIRPLLVPLSLGALFALLLFPLQKRLVRRAPRLRRLAPVLLTTGGIVLVVIPLVAVAARVVVSAQALLAAGPAIVMGRVMSFADTYFSGPIRRLGVPVESVRRGAVEIAQRVTTAIAGFAS